MLPASCYLLPTTCYLLPATCYCYCYCYCLPPTAYYLLPTTYFLISYVLLDFICFSAWCRYEEVRNANIARNRLALLHFGVGCGENSDMFGPPKKTITKTSSRLKSGSRCRIGTRKSPRTPISLASGSKGTPSSPHTPIELRTMSDVLSSEDLDNDDLSSENSDNDPSVSSASEYQDDSLSGSEDSSPVY